MKEFIEKLKTDPAFAEEFKNYLNTADEKVKEGTKEISKQLDKLVMGTIEGYAKEKGITLKDDADVQKQLGIMSKQISFQLNDMIVKQFKAMNLLKENGTTK